VRLLAVCAYTERPELVTLAMSFYDRVKNLLDEEQKKQVEEALYVDDPYSRRDLRGRIEQMNHDQNLDKLVPLVDWSAYFG
jgi:hypothetical protein